MDHKRPNMNPLSQHPTLPSIPLHFAQQCVVIGCPISFGDCNLVCVAWGDIPLKMKQFGILCGYGIREIFLQSFAKGSRITCRDMATSAGRGDCYATKIVSKMAQVYWNPQCSASTQLVYGCQ